VRLDAASVSQEVIAIVDSGAPRSLFPRAVADKLGIADALVPCDRSGEGAGGDEFDLWECTERITAQVIPQQGEVWGPVVMLDPAFSERGSFLLGVRDFFAAFTIEFDRSANPPKFWLHF
jgi:hypothetical protein